MASRSLRVVVALLVMATALISFASPAAASHTVTGVSPSALGQGAVTTVTITGTGFNALLTPHSVEVSGGGVTASEVRVVSGTEITAKLTVAPDAPLTARNVTVEQGAGGVDSASCTSCLTIVEGPTLTDVSPDSRGQGAVGQTLTLTGGLFAEDIGSGSVSFEPGGIAVISVTRDSESQLTIVVNVEPEAATGPRDVFVTNPDAGRATCTACFTVNPAPVITRVTPATLGRGGSAQLALEGTGFQPSPAVDFVGDGIELAAMVMESDTKIFVQVDVALDAARGASDIVVINVDGGRGGCAACFRPVGGGLWLAGGDGGIFALGPAPFLGSTGDIALNQPIVGMSGVPGRDGYWFVASDGGIFAYGVPFHGSTGSMALNKPVVGMAATPSGDGYWLVASDGGIFAFGDARFFGSTGDIALNQPIVGMAPTRTGNGYWLVASDGGIFAFGDAPYKGSTGDRALNQPVVGIASPSDDGYWLVARDGGIFAFGEIAYHGSAAPTRPDRPVVAIAGTVSGAGYWIVDAKGGIYPYGDASAVNLPEGTELSRPIVAAASWLFEQGL